MRSATCCVIGGIALCYMLISIKMRGQNIHAYSSPNMYIKGSMVAGTREPWIIVNALKVFYEKLGFTMSEKADRICKYI